jgi:ABC-type Zn uptake system ZnuABC Zn-binding protein ZnuA
MLRHTFLFTLIFTLTMTGITLGQTKRLQVATSFSMLEDLVHNVGQDRIQVRSFVPRGQDRLHQWPWARGLV